MQCFEGEQHYFEYDAILHRQPMLFLQCRCYAAVLWGTCDDTGCQVLHTLQLLDGIFWYSIQKRVAIYNSWREARSSRQLAFVGNIMSTTSGRGRGSRPESRYTQTRPSRLGTSETRLLEPVRISLMSWAEPKYIDIHRFVKPFLLESSHNDSYTYSTRSQSKRKTRYVAYWRVNYAYLWTFHTGR